MRQAVLDALVAARRDKRAVVLATRLGDGAQCLIDGEATTGDLSLDDAIRAAAAEARRADKGRTIEDGEAAVFVQPFNPPLRLVVVGAVHIAQPLVPMAQIAGYEVTVVDPRRTFATDERFPDVSLSDEWPDDALSALKPDHRTAIVTLTHDPKLDDPALDVALGSDAFYIAALGSRKTHAARLDRLAEAGHDRASLDRIHGPAGLPIGAVSPAEVAVAILAQMTGVLRGSAL